MIYGYIRKCTEESQRSAIGEFAAQNGVAIGQWTEDINPVAAGDIVITSDISQIGTDILPVLDKLALLLKAGVQVWTAEEGYKLGGDSLRQSRRQKAWAAIWQRLAQAGGASWRNAPPALRGHFQGGGSTQVGGVQEHFVGVYTEYSHQMIRMI